MLKKYKMSHKASSPWAMRTRILYFILAWNALAFAGYQWYSKKREGDEEWKAMSMTEKYLDMMTRPDDKVNIVSIKGLDFKGRQQELMKVGDIMKQKREAQTASKE